ncbi:MAG: isoprenylcysteine carboxylmethyltransferase family protein [Terriglobia bacterium]|jgi:protein-S-isoprenylcysteine O-methyltransferase Ste14
MSPRVVGPILKTLLFAILVPGSVLVCVPYILLTKHVPRPEGWLNWLALAPCGLGALILLTCAWNFAVVGHGTPAPIDPPKSLVVSGPYRFVRNPMYVGIDLVLFSEALLFSSPKLLVYALLFGIGFHLFVLAYEEPTLRKKFGASYQAYCQAVPRWIPRLTPWSPEK